MVDLGNIPIDDKAQVVNHRVFLAVAEMTVYVVRGVSLPLHTTAQAPQFLGHPVLLTSTERRR